MQLTHLQNSTVCLFLVDTEEEDVGDPLSLDEIFSPYFTIRHFDSTWIEGNKRKNVKL